MDLLEFTKDILDPISIWVGIIISVPVFWTWWQVTFGKERQIRKWSLQARKSLGNNPAVLIIDLLPDTEMRPQVEQYLNRQGLKFPEDRYVIYDRKNTIAPQDMPELYKEIHHAVARINFMAADVVHVFYGGPGCGAALLGGELSNLPCNIHYYQSSHGVGYQDFGPIRYPHIPRTD